MCTLPARTGLANKCLSVLWSAVQGMAHCVSQPDTPGAAHPPHGLHDLPWTHMLRFLGLLEVTSLRLTCRQVRDTLDHNLECIKVRPSPCTAMWSALHSAVTRAVTCCLISGHSS